MAEDVHITLDPETWETLRELLNYRKRYGLWNPAAPVSGTNLPLPTPAYFHNDAGEEIPAFACMQVTGTEEIDGQNYLVVEKPADTDGSGGGFIFNGPEAVADDTEGRYQVGPIVRGYKNTGTATGGDKWRPTSGQWYLTKDDEAVFSFAVCGDDDVNDDVFKLVIDQPGMTLFRFTLNEDMGATTTNQADADILLMDGTDTGRDADVLDPEAVFGTLTNTDSGLCLKQGASYYVIQAPCP